MEHQSQPFARDEQPLYGPPEPDGLLPERPIEGPPHPIGTIGDHGEYEVYVYPSATRRAPLDSSGNPSATELEHSIHLGGEILVADPLDLNHTYWKHQFVNTFSFLSKALKNGREVLKLKQGKKHVGDVVVEDNPHKPGHRNVYMGAAAAAAVITGGILFWQSDRKPSGLGGHLVLPDLPQLKKD